MIPVLSAEQTRIADNWTIEHEPIASLDLMERAAAACTGWISAHYGRSTRFRILCGPGNNGGDGLAIARQLYQSGYDVTVDRISVNDRFRADHLANFQRLQPLLGADLREIRAEADFSGIDPEVVLIDALFGSGLERPLSGLFRTVVERINASSAEIISIDLPSGLPADGLMSDLVAVHADSTLCFQTPKRTFFFPEAGEYAGRWVLLDIGVRTDHFPPGSIREYLFTRSDLLTHVGRRRRFAHKGDFGHGLLVAGSDGKIGAAILASRAALRTGLGLLTTHVPEVGILPLQTAVPEAMVSRGGSAGFLERIPADLSRFDAIAVGPGLGMEAESVTAFDGLLRSCKVPLVLDADGLNMLSKNQSLLDHVPAGTILTPHPGEFDRLFGSCPDTPQRIERAKAFTATSGCILILKGGCTAVVLPSGEVRYNANGNPGMAKGGSGDALTGVLLALLCNGMQPEIAASAGVFLHAAAGDLAAEKYGERGLLPSDLIKALPAVLRSLESGV